MKLWIDDVRPAPKGYVWCNSVNDAINTIKLREARIEKKFFEVIHRPKLE